MYMWSDKKRFEKLLRSVQKWMEFQNNPNSSINEDVVKRAYSISEKYSAEIVESFGVQTNDTKDFLQRWIQLTLFSGYLSGWDHPNGPAEQLDSIAKEFAADLAKKTFDNLLSDPISPLVMGLSPDLLQLLRACHESGLYAGFRQGLEDSYQSTPKTFDPFDTEKIFS
jgi:hypothetical protein